MEHPGYEGTIDKMTQSLVEFCREEPRALGLHEPWGLFDLGYKVPKDLRPSLAQASGCLVKAQAIVREERRKAMD